MPKKTETPADLFLTRIQEEAEGFNAAISTDSGDWIVKGFIDIFRNVYTISGDTKVVSKLIELLLFPRFVAFADRYGYKLVLSPHQNFYPDLTFIDKDENRFALDLKSTYRLTAKKVPGMTLGAFTGYFRQRSSVKNTTFPYGSYAGHFVLGVIYSRADLPPDELKIHTIDELLDIPSVVRNLVFFAQPKYRIAKDLPGSGNTCNIGAVTSIDAMIFGRGPFSELGEEVFDDYWMYYMTKQMARQNDLEKPPYTTLVSYYEYKGIKGKKR